MIVPMYHSEIAATKVRGRIITFQQWAITFGIAISFWINYGTYIPPLTINERKITFFRQVEREI